jgi:DNA-binding response OmpR family regulator
MRILIAEDHPELRSLLADLLIRKGHEVVAATNGEEAMRTYSTDEGKFDLLITDYQMPKKNGVVLIMEIRRCNPNQKVILVSGDPPQITDTIREDAGEFPILRKPYRNDDLFALIDA